ncbi:TIGR01244 family sulfur transferase [Pseudovibrio sp. SPO723]|uniref:TIGR01244 family sulfur transferase n=1 Tax=Nesiotobacter zosterae TaxID=392721 RepID=UPI0029C5DD8E|nr:TIGR01244 family sulfur transferase [Pseudovibrio sp. SPO723]MDX5593394.1 TIGR01244 family sulfur transferase [Pseudovibrio sp. SPO723]
MSIRQLTPDFFVAGQITPEDVPALKEHGFNALICNRPDGEDFGQPTVAEVNKAAEEAGMELVFIPVDQSSDLMTAALEMAEAIDRLPAPVLAYCRSGARCTTLFQAAQSLPKAG